MNHPTPTSVPARGRIPASERLAQLAEVFSVEDFQKEQNLSAKAASVYLARWQAQNFIARLGPRSGLWVNLSKIGSIGINHRLAGLLRKHPDSLIAGPTALALAGWIKTTAAPTVVVPQGSSKAQFDGIDLTIRSPRVEPAVALADWLAQGNPAPEGLTEEQLAEGREAARSRNWTVA
jgi:hypothetical protein